MNSNLTNTRDPVQLWTGSLAFLFPFLSLVTLFGVSLGSFLFLATALISFKPCRDALAPPLAAGALGRASLSAVLPVRAGLRFGARSKYEHGGKAVRACSSR
jgi:hypothetical protein